MKKIELYRIRTFSDIFEDSIQWLKDNRRAVLRYIAPVAGVCVVILSSVFLWAYIMSEEFYEIDFDREGLLVHRFEPDLEWAMFVAWNRRVIPERFRSYYDERFLPIMQENDVITGKIANDRMVVVLDWFFNGFISDVGLLMSLQALGLGDQYCALTSEACNHVKVISEKALSANECANLRAKSENQRSLAVRMVDRIRLEHRRDGSFFSEIIERETGRSWT